jgi:hypothetical protein
MLDGIKKDGAGKKQQQILKYKHKRLNCQLDVPKTTVTNGPKLLGLKPCRFETPEFTGNNNAERSERVLLHA